MLIHVSQFYKFQCILCFLWLEWHPVHYGAYEFPYWTALLGWAISLVPVMAIPVAAIMQFCMARGSVVQVGPSFSRITPNFARQIPEPQLCSEMARRAESVRLVGSRAGRSSCRTVSAAGEYITIRVERENQSAPAALNGRTTENQ